MSRDHFSARIDAKLKKSIYQIAEEADIPMSRLIEELLNWALVAVDRRNTKRFGLLQWKRAMLVGRL